jgi:hypothetical protein
LIDAYFNAAVIELNGKPPKFLTLFILSSSMAYTTFPSIISAAAELA